MTQAASDRALLASRRARAVPLSSTLLRLAFEPLVALFFPAPCAICGDPGREAMCASCRAALETEVGVRCVRCDLPLPADDAPCPDCLRLGDVAFEKTMSLGPYRGVLKAAVLALKYHDAWRLAEPLASAMSQCVRRSGIHVDLVVALPIDRHRQQARGYNQSALLASRLAVHLGLPHRRRLLTRCVDGVVQSTADENARHLQVEGIFEADAAVHGKRILMVDDVMTSGATMNAAASALRAGGARVWGVVAARQMLRRRADQAHTTAHERGIP